MPGSFLSVTFGAAGRFSFTVQDEQPPYKYVSVEGDVTHVGPADESEARSIAVRYLGEESGKRVRRRE